MIKLMPVGGTGALVATPNERPLPNPMPKTTFLPTPVVSSLPYIDIDTADARKKAVLELSIANATRKANNPPKAQYLYEDYNTYTILLPSGKLQVFEKVKEPTTEDMLRDYLKNKLLERDDVQLKELLDRVNGTSSKMQDLIRTQQVRNERTAAFSGIQIPREMPEEITEQQQPARVTRQSKEPAATPRMYKETGMTKAEMMAQLRKLDVSFTTSMNKLQLQQLLTSALQNAEGGAAAGGAGTK
jgi:hypothetical protein